MTDDMRMDWTPEQYGNLREWMGQVNTRLDNICRQLDQMKQKMDNGNGNLRRTPSQVVLTMSERAGPWAAIALAISVMLQQIFN